jgi:pantoate--beta-alanine ligase
MKTIRSVREMQDWAEAERRAGRRIGLVPTMGFLHEGHLSLVRLAKTRADRVVVSIFVNPTQFNSRDDFEKYPRDEVRDARLLADGGADLLFVPTAEEMYPRGSDTRVEVSELARGLCGAHRPGHFAGVTTVVTKLFLATKPHVAVFGEKDYQQLQIVRRMARDLLFDVEIVAGATERESDGLALSSRNARLSEEWRLRARAIPRAFDSVRAASGGVVETERLGGLFFEEAERAGLRVEYAEFRDPQTLLPVEEIEGPTLFAVAVWAGDVRLIDNVILTPPQGVVR